MTRRETGHMNGQQFLANTKTREVHDLDNEQDRCRIDAIIDAGHDKPYIFLHQAHQDGYDNCGYCMIGSLR